MIYLDLQKIGQAFAKQDFITIKKEKMQEYPCIRAEPKRRTKLTT